MGERLQSKPEEQYPLLKIDGGGDINHQSPQPVANTGWGVTCTNKYPRFSRWPEFISACWMTLIICGISFLIFYALGMGVYSRNQFIIMKCNNSKPASNVYYHQIVPRGNQITFSLYSKYLANTAVHYPLLNFNVFFLIDDSYPDTLRGPRHNIPYHPFFGMYKLDEIKKDALDEFQKKYPNVNIAVMPLSKYMATTPLRFRWRMIPMAHLLFYIRVVAIWQNGGIGIDLRTFNNDYHSHHSTDSRINVILRQHNDGINTEVYTDALNKINKDEENAFYNMFYGILNHFINETRSFLNRTLTFPAVSDEDNNLVRSKREVNNDSLNAVLNKTKGDTKTSTMHALNVIPTYNISTNVSHGNALQNFTVVANDTVLNASIATSSNGKMNSSETHKTVLFYDFTIFSDSIGPPYLITEPIHKPVQSSMKTPDATKPPYNTVPHLLTIDSEGFFIAATSKLHPFLGYLISSGCQSMPPNFAIQNALLSQCSGLLKEDVYCNNIFIL